MDTIKIAIVFTCHNRINKTKQAISGVNTQMVPDDIQINKKFFVCDDASTDGTFEYLKSLDNVHVVSGDGTLFWAKGMALAIKAAEQYEPDYYLMINDDVAFFKNTLITMWKSLAQIKEPCVVVGSTFDNAMKHWTYGGYQWNHRVFGEIKEPVLPQNSCVECDLCNWNCVLIPNEIYQNVGRIDDYYEHGLADFDYSIRVKQKGYKLYVAPGYIGICNRNSKENTWLDCNLSLPERFKLIQKKTAMPIKSYIHYCRKFYGIFWPFQVIKPYLAIVATDFRHNRKIHNR